ncbi:type II toxin-antitoxin system RelE/ParE family toxin [Paenisporosarcina sp. TG20]|uniref:type II toxin-antitoxin system RelE/ParE family toxin n=1 Tax=Paenisporosarcina sp. TG20 TaxID=1211706 RepID=UPI0003702A71|nr:type II toxin-antitoxin system RelE/ParE family toxin [Paenisporosarcina sp. TG20]
MHYKKLFTQEYIKPNGKIPIREFLDSLENTSVVRLLSKLHIIEELGLSVGRNLAKYFNNHKLWELRVNNLRVFFIVDEGHMILLNGFIKKSNKTPQKELNLAVCMRNEWINSKVQIVRKIR